MPGTPSRYRATRPTDGTAGPVRTRSRPPAGRTRSSTIVGAGSPSRHRSKDVSASTHRVVSDSSASAAENALSSIHGTLSREGGQAQQKGHLRTTSWPSPPKPTLATIPSAPSVPTRSSLDGGSAFNLGDAAQLQLYTYKPTASTSFAPQPLPLPATPTSTGQIPASQVLFSFNSLPFLVQSGDFLEIRRIGDAGLNDSTVKGPRVVKTGGEALKKVQRGRDGFIFRVGADAPNIPLDQIHIPESIAAAFFFQHRLDVHVRKVRYWQSRQILWLTPNSCAIQVERRLTMWNCNFPSISAAQTCGAWGCHWKVQQYMSARKCLWQEVQ